MKKIIFTLAAIVAAVNLSAQSTTPVTKTGKCGETITITATAGPGYEFDHWQDGITVNPRIITIDETLSVLNYEATFKAIAYTITVSTTQTDMGSVSATVTTAGYNEKVTIEAKPKNGCYEFVSWSDGDTNATRELTITDNVNLTATFQEKIFTIQVTAGANGSVSVE